MWFLLLLQRRLGTRFSVNSPRLRVLVLFKFVWNLPQLRSDLSAADYFRKMKGLANELSSIGAPLRDDEVIAYILSGLGPDYDSYVTSMTRILG